MVKDVNEFSSPGRSPEDPGSTPEILGFRVEAKQRVDGLTLHGAMEVESNNIEKGAGEILPPHLIDSG